MKSTPFAPSIFLGALLFAAAASISPEYSAAATVTPAVRSIGRVGANELADIANVARVLGPAQYHRSRIRTLSVSTTSLNFGTVTLNTASAQSITLKSTGTASVTIDALAVSGAGYAVAGPALPLRLYPGQSTTVEVSFDPKVAGAATGDLSITSSSSTGSTMNVSLTGTGSGNTASPVLTLSTTSLNFGSVGLGTPISQSVTLSSTGTSAVTVSAASLAGAAFTFSGATFPVTLNPGVAVSVQVRFDPMAVGTASGTLTFTSNSTRGSSSVVMLSGTGTTAAHQVSLTWAAPANSPAGVSGYNVYRAAAGSTSFVRLNASADAQTAYLDQAVTAGASYSYYVKSVDAAGVESSPSNQVSVTIP